MNISFTSAEMAAIAAHADAAGLTPERLVRNLVTAAVPGMAVQSNVAEFVRSHCEIVPTATVSNTAIYEAYRAVIQDPVSHRAFSLALKALGFQQAPGRTAGRMVQGLRLRG